MSGIPRNRYQPTQVRLAQRKAVQLATSPRKTKPQAPPQEVPMKRRYVPARSRSNKRQPPSHCAACARGLWAFRRLACPRLCGQYMCRDVDRCLQVHLTSCPNVNRTFTDSPQDAA